jgi:branched-subunit amino acid ABC-type transport system permease component
MSIFWISVGLGLAVAAILALSAVAFTFEYAVSRVVNRVQSTRVEDPLDRYGRDDE